MGSNVGLLKYRSEIIREWVETEVLRQVSIEKKLLNNDNFVKIIETSKKELAASIAIQNYLDSNPIKIAEKDLISFYNNNKKDFHFSNDAFVVNLASFSNEKNAIAFREKAIKNGWNEAIAFWKTDTSVITILQENILKLSGIQSKRILRVLKRLYKKEISLVIRTELNNFVVVQQIDRINKNTVPKFKYIKDNIKESYLVLKQQEMIKKYLDSLIAKKKVKIY